MSNTSRLAGARKSVLAVVATTALAGAALYAPAVFAADEDTQASVYLVFDPETGEFVTVHDTEGTAKATEEQEAIASVADAPAGEAAAAPDTGTTAPAAQSGSSSVPVIAVALLAAIIGGVVLQRRRGKAS